MIMGNIAKSLHDNVFAMLQTTSGNHIHLMFWINVVEMLYKTLYTMKYGNIMKTVPDVVIKMIPMTFGNNIVTMFYDVPVTF
jgi:hypothetical protein